MRTYTGKLFELPENGIFVFGSNMQGRHGAGAARVASEYFGAIHGQGFGLQGKSYGIITKDLTAKSHPSVNEWEIEQQIEFLYGYARMHPELDFYVAYSNAENERYLSNYTPKEMAEFFSTINIPDNIIFEENFAKLVVEVSARHE